jgi:hypothetical protein
MVCLAYLLGAHALDHEGEALCCSAAAYGAVSHKAGHRPAAASGMSAAADAINHCEPRQAARPRGYRRFAAPLGMRAWWGGCP